MLTTAVAPVTIVGSPMRQRQARRPRPEDAGLVDELEVGRDGPLGEVDRDVRQPDADEADVLAGQLARGGHDHHLGLAEGAGARSRDLLDVVIDGLAEAPRRRDHPVGALGRTADPQTGVAAREEPLGDGWKISSYGIAAVAVALAPAR